MLSPVDQIKERLNIVDVISMYIPLTPAGKDYKGKSPFKQERTPSFYVSPEKGLYHCFSTGKGGDMFTFVQEMEGLDFRGALKVLADKAGISLSGWNPKDEEKKDRLYKIMEEAARIFEEELARHEEVIQYIKGRGLEPGTIKEFRIGYAPPGWRNLYGRMKETYTDADLAAVGLIKTAEKGAYDTFRDRIMFPISDSSGRVIAFSGRIFTDDGKSAKYVNSPDTPLFNKSDILFGIDKAKHYIRKYNFTTIVEGQFDVISLHQAGFRNTVAVSGTALADSLIGRDRQVNNLGIVKRLSNNLVLAFDSDAAGVSAAKRSARIAMSLGMDVKVVDISGGKDPADFLRDFGKDAWSKILRQAEHVIIFNTKKICQEVVDERLRGRMIKDGVLPDLALIESEIERSYFVKKISELTGIPEASISADLSRAKRPDSIILKEGNEQTKPPPPSNVSGIEREVFGIYIASGKDEGIRKRIIEIAGEDEFRRINEALAGKETEFIFSNSDNGVAADETFANFKKSYLQKEIKQIKERRKEAEANGDDEKADELLRQQHALELQRDQINNSRYS